MEIKNNSQIEVDLVFKLSERIPYLIKNKTDIDIEIFDNQFWEKVFLCWLRIIIDEKKSYFQKIISNKKSFSLSFEIVSDCEIANLNQKWLNKKGPTDVLSFPMIFEKNSLDEIIFIELGDLFVSLDTDFKQSLEYGHSLKREFLWLVSHGFLHLLGWDHKNQKELDNMLNFQEYLISRINLDY